jgi:hypothetical protein
LEHPEPLSLQLVGLPLSVVPPHQVPDRAPAWVIGPAVLPGRDDRYGGQAAEEKE